MYEVGDVAQLEEKQKIAETGNRTQASAATKRGTAIILSRRQCRPMSVRQRKPSGLHPRMLAQHMDRHLSKAVNASAS